MIRVKTIQSVRRRGRKEENKQHQPIETTVFFLSLSLSLYFSIFSYFHQLSLGFSFRRSFGILAMSSGGVNSCNGSPRLVGPTTTKQRVVDTIDVERSSNFSDVFEEEDNPNSNNGDHHCHCHHPSIRYWLLRSRIFFFTLETWLLKIENGCSWAARTV